MAVYISRCLATDQMASTAVLDFKKKGKQTSPAGQKGLPCLSACPKSSCPLLPFYKMHFPSQDPFWALGLGLAAFLAKSPKRSRLSPKKAKSFPSQMGKDFAKFPQVFSPSPLAPCPFGSRALEHLSSWALEPLPMCGKLIGKRLVRNSCKSFLPL